MSNIKYGIAWSDRYSLGDERVDGQHKKLFELLSDLVCSCQDGTKLESVKEALDFLAGYTVQHFIDEEALQIHYGYPDYERHKKIHEDFKVTVGELVKKFEISGSSDELSKDMNTIVIRWLTGHILGEDKKIGAYIKENSD